jgi:hypothetical protein
MPKISATEYSYTDKSGTERILPLREADTEYSCRIFKTDKRKAVPMSKTDCHVALGVNRGKDVLFCEIGSGRDCFVGFKGRGRQPPYVLHYMLPINVQRIIAEFDRSRKVPETMWITLTPPPRGDTLAVRQERHKAQASAAAVLESMKKAEEPREVSFIAHPDGSVEKQKKRRRSRQEREGVGRRPRAIVRDGAWIIPPADEAGDEDYA